MPTIGMLTAAATARSWATATGLTAGPESPPCPAAMPGFPVAGSIALALSVLISETASAPPCSAAAATSAGFATLGVSFTINGFSLSGRSASSSASVSLGCSPTIRPECTFGHETLSSIAATSSLSPTPLTSRANSSCPVAITETISGTGSCASSGRSSTRNPANPLLGNPIELIIPAGVSQIRCGSLPALGSGVIVFETNAENGNSARSSSPKTRRAAIASNVPDALTTGCANSIPQNSTMPDCPASSLGRPAGSWLPGGGAVGGPAAEEALATAGSGGSPAATAPAGPPRNTGPSTQRRIKPPPGLGTAQP